MSGNYSSTGGIGEIVGAGAPPKPDLMVRSPEDARRAMFGEVLLDRLSGGLRNMQQKINRIVRSGRPGRQWLAADIPVRFLGVGGGAETVIRDVDAGEMIGCGARARHLVFRSHEGCRRGGDDPELYPPQERIAHGPLPAQVISV